MLMFYSKKTSSISTIIEDIEDRPVKEENEKK
jgi:hypothetical protein